MSCEWTSFDDCQSPLRLHSIANLAEDMVYRLPGCGDVMIRKTLEHAYRDFCERSDALVMTAKILLKSGKDTYVIAVPFNGFVHSVRRVRVTGSSGCLKLGKDYRTADGIETAITLDDRFLPDSSDTAESILYVECVIVPSIGSEDAPSWFLQRYGNAVVSGALFYLFEMTNKPWSDPALAKQMAIEYENALTTAKAKSLSPNTSQSDSGHIDVTVASRNGGNLWLH